MANKQEVTVQVGPGFFGLLTLLFVGLKLTNYIDWSWLWVLSPLWLPFVIFFGLAALFFVGYFIFVVCLGTLFSRL